MAQENNITLMEITTTGEAGAVALRIPPTPETVALAAEAAGEHTPEVLEEPAGVPQ